jgi:hypothetical protein
MLHDVGLLHPYPHLVTKEEQLNIDLSLKSYLQAGYDVGKKSFFHMIAMCAKYCSSNIIHWTLQKTIDIYLVPSSFLVAPLQKWL